MQVRITIIAALLAATSVLASDALSEKLYAATRKDNAKKVARLLEGGVSGEVRLVAISVGASRNASRAFDVLWDRDNSDLSSASIDYALCYAFVADEPRPNIRQVIVERGLTVEGCCRGNAEAPFCARQPIRLVDERFPAECATVYVEAHELPPGTTSIATIWDERVSVLNPTESAKYGLPELTKRGARDWALELCEGLGAIGADAILITDAERRVDSRSSVATVPGRRGPSTSGVQFGLVSERIEAVALRTRSASPLQGSWQLRSEWSGSESGTLDIDGDRFVSSVIHGDYVGRVVLRRELSPAQIDFIIDECGGCKFVGMAAEGIFRENDDGSFSFAAPAPGEPRPSSFDEMDPDRILFERATLR